MNIYDDNRLTRWGQRRLHSAFEEVGGSQTWTVPTVAGEIARAVCETVTTRSTLYVTKDDATLVPAVINTVIRTRAAGRIHPRRNENQPAELGMRDPGAARSLRPPRLQAPAHAAAEAAARRVPTPSSRTPPRTTPSKPERGRDD